MKSLIRLILWRFDLGSHSFKCTSFGPILYGFEDYYSSNISRSSFLNLVIYNTKQISELMLTRPNIAGSAAAKKYFFMWVQPVDIYQNVYIDL